jgi:hypothetical protein
MRSFAAMLALAVIWGLSVPVTKFGLVTMPPLTLTAFRFAVAVPLLFLFVLGRPLLPWRAFPPVAALGILGIGVGQVTQTLGVVGTSSSVGTIITATIPGLRRYLRRAAPETGRVTVASSGAARRLRRNCAGRVGKWRRGGYGVPNHRGRC